MCLSLRAYFHSLHPVIYKFLLNLYASGPCKLACFPWKQELVTASYICGVAVPQKEVCQPVDVITVLLKKSGLK